MTTRIRDGREVTVNPGAPVGTMRRMLAALIDAEEMLHDYAHVVEGDSPLGLWPTIYKVRDAIRAAEDPKCKVSVRCG
jgi:hypothetical protein